ncbi:hypothetical protein AV521_30850 [Streptomyces sp. IMTB 2501]|nr:hypothetical protein AV521_30850 [Streptomyces sp. IMTB 2501]
MKAPHIITGPGVGGAGRQPRLPLRHLPVRCAAVTPADPGPVAGRARRDGARVTVTGGTAAYVRVVCGTTASSEPPGS